MAIFLKNIQFHGVLVDTLVDEGNPEWETVSELFYQGIKDGVVQPLNTTVFDKEDIESAFRYMAQGNHIGKVVLKVLFQKTFYCKNSGLKIHDGYNRL